MSQFTVSKVNGNTVGADEWNQLAGINNAITTSGQTPSTSDTNQLGIGAARYSSGGQYFTDSGTADAYVLSSVLPFKAPVDATNDYFVGMTIRFRAGNANSGASTVNVNSAGVKNLKKEDGTTDLAGGDIPTGRDVEFKYDGTAFALVLTNATTSTKGVSYLAKQITIANNVTTPNTKLDFTAGNAQADDGYLVFSVAALTKQIDATWVAGTNQGGLDTGTVAINTWYHCYAIYNPSTLASDFLFTTTYGSPTLPSGFTKKKWVMAVLTDGSANIIPFTQTGKHVDFGTSIVNYSATTSIPTSFTNLSVSAPTGIRVKVWLNFFLNTPAALSRNASVKDIISGQAREAVYGFADDDNINTTYCFTNLTSQIQHKLNAATTDGYSISSIAWEIPDLLF